MHNENRQVANSILARLKDGEEFSQSVVRTALTDTGDIAPDGRTGLGQEIPQNSDGGGEIESMGMVAENLIRLSKKAWTSRR